MNRILKVGAFLRVPSINAILYRGESWKPWSNLSFQVFRDLVKHMTPTDKPVIVVFTVEFDNIKYVVDADNLRLKSALDSLKGYVINQDGFQEVVEVRKRSRHTDRNYVTIEVFET